MRRHRPPERPSAAGIRIKSPRARFDRLSGRISGTRTDTPPSGSSPRRRKATQRGLSKRPRFTQIRGRFLRPSSRRRKCDTLSSPRHRKTPPHPLGAAGCNSEPTVPQVAIQSPQRLKSHQARSASSRAKALSAAGRTKPTAPQVEPSPRRRRSDPVPLRRRSHQSPQNRRSDPVPRTAGRNTELVALPCSTCR